MFRVMQRVNVDTDNLFIWYGDHVHLDRINFPQFWWLKCSFPKFYMPLAKTSERWGNPYNASSTRRKRSANVVKAQCTHCERRDSAVKASPSHQAAFPLRWHGVVQISNAPWDRKQILIFFEERGLSRRPYGVLTATMTLLQSSHGVLSRS